MVNVDLLITEIEDIGVKKDRLAQKCGFTTATLNNKLANPDSITVADAYNFAVALRIPIESQKFLNIFFAPYVETKVQHEVL